MVIITTWLWTKSNDALPTPRRHLRRPGGPHAPRDPRPARPGGRLGCGTGGTLRHEPAGDLQAPEGAGARRPHLDGAGRAAPPAQDRRRAPRRSDRLARGIPAVLGAPLQRPR